VNFNQQHSKRIDKNLTKLAHSSTPRIDDVLAIQEKVEKA